jgi:cytosine/adenosine deaminase-related metal-dependent hydrolase
MIAVHACWFDEGERALLAERGGGLAYCPGSNMFLGDGVTDLVDLVARGVTIGLGTDGGCSNNRVSVFDEMRTAALLQKVHRVDGQAIRPPRPRLAPGHRGGGQTCCGCRSAGIEVGYRCDAGRCSTSTTRRCGRSRRWPRTWCTRCRRAPSPTSW